MTPRLLPAIAFFAALALASRAAAQPTFTPVPLFEGQSITQDWEVADLDGDGDGDIILIGTYGLRWYEHDGSPEPAFTRHDIDTVGDTSGFVGDIDGDGDLDIVASDWSPGAVLWYENDGATPPSFTTHVVIDNVSQTPGVFAIDLDADGDTDILSASRVDDSVRWYENDGQQNFTPRVIADALIGATAVKAADMDGDGDLDVVSSAEGVYWHENDGQHQFVAHLIDTFDSALCTDFAIADLNSDGHLDLVASGTDTYGTQNDTERVSAYLNDGATSPTFTREDIVNDSYALDLHAVNVGDLDHDGDLDVVTAQRWFAAPDWQSHWFAGVGGSTWHSFPITDLDRDSDLDFVVAGSTVYLFESDLTPEGACCLPSGDCVSSTAVGCLATDGIYQGDGTFCADFDCPRLIGACCLPTGACVETDAVACAAAYGFYQGDGTFCADFACPPPTPGDLDFDRDVDFADFALFQQNWTGPN